MLTPDNFKTMVGYQECGGNGPFATGYLLEVVYSEPEDWIKYIRSLTNEQVFNNLIGVPPKITGLNVTPHTVNCIFTFEEILEQANTLLLSLPKVQSKYSGSLKVMHAKNKIAVLSLRGLGNVMIGNVLVFRGSNNVDCCMAIIKCNNRYGIIKQKYFDRYGFIL